MNKPNTLGKNLGDTCYWFTSSVSQFSKKLYFPSIDNLHFREDTKYPFISKIANINNNVNVNDTNSISKVDIKFIKSIIKIINCNLNNDFNLKIKISNLLITSKTQRCSLKIYTTCILNNIIDVISKESNSNNNINIDYQIISVYNDYKKIVDSNDIIRSYKYEIMLPRNKHKIITNWIKICNHFYNHLAFKYNEFLSNNIDSIYSFKKPFIVIKKEIFDDYFTNILVSTNKAVIDNKININSISYNSKSKTKKSKPVPFDMITDELRAFCSNLKSCKSNKSNDNIKKFELKEQDYVRNTRSVLLPKKNIAKKGIFVNILGKVSNFNNKIVDLLINNKISHDCRLIYDYSRKKVYCAIPQTRVKENKVKEQKYVALDPGVKIFQTFYGEKLCGTIGEEIGEERRKRDLEIKKYEKVIKEKVNLHGKKLKNKWKVEEKIRRIIRKYDNKVTDMQNKAANFICKTWETILIPPFRVKPMVNNTTGNINKEVKKTLLSLRHYRFKQQIMNKGEEYGCRVKLVGEEYTSQCCGNCGVLSNEYKDRVKECINCGIKINRDVNGAYNILIKNNDQL